MSRLIDADALKPSYVVTSTTTNSLCHLYVSIEDINSAPTVDAVPVVRCRDCRFSQRINDWVYQCYVFNVDKTLNQYCDMGKRKDGGDEKAD